MKLIGNALVFGIVIFFSTVCLTQDAEQEEPASLVTWSDDEKNITLSGDDLGQALYAANRVIEACRKGVQHLTLETDVKDQESLCDTIADLFPNLISITARGIGLQQIPRAWSGLSQLKELRLDNNKIKFLPEWLLNSNIVQLSVTGNADLGLISERFEAFLKKIEFDPAQVPIDEPAAYFCDRVNDPGSPEKKVYSNNFFIRHISEITLVQSGDIMLNRPQEFVCREMYRAVVIGGKTIRFHFDRTASVELPTKLEQEIREKKWRKIFGTNERRKLKRVFDTCEEEGSREMTANFNELIKFIYCEDEGSDKTLRLKIPKYLRTKPEEKRIKRQENAVKNGVGIASRLGVLKIELEGEFVRTPKQVKMRDYFNGDYMRIEHVPYNNAKGALK